MTPRLTAFVKDAMNSHERREIVGRVLHSRSHSRCSCGWEPDEEAASLTASTWYPDNPRAQRARFTDEMVIQWSDHTTEVVLRAVADWLELPGVSNDDEIMAAALIRVSL